MQQTVTLFAQCLLSSFVAAASAAEVSSTPSFPLQLEMRVPFGPTAFPSEGNTYLAYELYLTNFSSKDITLRRIEVVDPDAKRTDPILVFEGEQMNSQLQHVGTQESDNTKLSPGGTAVAFVWIALASTAHVPTTVRHRVVASDSTAEGATIST